MPDELRQAILSLLDDIESMQEGPWRYGPFDVFPRDDVDGAIIEWPNLEISARRVRELLQREGE